MGAVGGIRNIRSAARAARAVMQHTRHSVLVGEQAAEFAMAMGLDFSDLTTQASAELHRGWLEGGCQPNFRRAVSPAAADSCGPYSAAASGTCACDPAAPRLRQWCVCEAAQPCLQGQCRPRQPG